ncbi:hypothetical protein Q0590_19045 [Rhodocytophaga aerolata]|uniref:Uncharacterized protein n=1 Tax=Rhodocytophaga aerolata TaxID=455078 RepID=A0ABT8R8F4_9BACT|nr:hypothetical protein [Rhodocytophaga aerolata]MDO1448381.1 hypothetical protein [Rhodocytophaga aerolata]
MNTTENFRYQVIDFLHTTFPDSQQMEAGELYEGVAFLLEKAATYGLQTEADLVTYVITGYLLGLNFDTQMPAATEILTDSALSGTYKADWLQQWTQQIFQTLESDGPATAEEERSVDTFTPEMDMGHYLTMQADAEPFNVLAEEVIKQMMAGDASGLRTHFSPNFLHQIGEQTFEQVCTDLLLPFFEKAQTLGQSSTITYTTDSFGSTGFAFYRTLTESGAEKPFIIYTVYENNQIVVANLVINKTYADMH